MKARTSRKTRKEALLINMAGSIGSTLGAIAGGARAVQKALSGSSVSRTVKREGAKLVKKKTAGPKTGRRVSSRAASSAKRSAGRARSKA